MTWFNFFLGPLLSGGMALATTPLPLVVYIGGAKSNSEQMRCWVAGASVQKGNAFEFRAYPYPRGVTLDHGSDKQPNGIALINKMASDLAKEGQRQIIIVGHSSGSDLANALALKLHSSGQTNLVLYDLEGYGVPASVPKSIPTSCVTAFEPGSNIKSFYWGASHSCNGGNVIKLPISGCEGNKWCLHFRLANQGAGKNLSKENYETNGYANGCRPNFDWLKVPGKPASHAPVEPVKPNSDSPSSGSI